MTEFHVAIDHLESPDPDSPMEVTTTYLGVCDQDHVDQVRAIAALEDSPRFELEHPHIDGAFTVLRDDGDLDVYVPVGAPEYRVYAPDSGPKDPRAMEDYREFTKEEQAARPVRGGTVVGGAGGSIDLSAITEGTVTAQDLPEGILPRGASGPAYISGVTRFGDQSIGGASDSPNKPPRAVWHTTESPAGGGYFTSIAAYLIRIGAEPQVIYCPVTDRLGQFGPLTQSARALQNDGSYRTNRTGKVCIQVEVLGYAKSPWTNGFDPADKPNYRRLIAAMRAHGIPDVWPVGKPPATAAAATKRPKTTWEDKGGHYAHGQIRGQNHWDPGAIDTAIVPGKVIITETGPGGGTPTGSTYTVKDGDTLWSIAQKYDTTVAKLVALNGLKDADKLTEGQKLKVPSKTAPATPVYEPFPGEAFFHGGRHSAVITAMGRRLVAVGCGKYSNGPGPNWTNADKASYAAWQRKLGYTGAAADGIPGKTSWDKLRVPKI